MCYTPPICSAQSMVSHRFGQLYGSTYEANQSAMLFSNRNFCLTFLNICATDQQMPEIINVIRDIALSHMAISKGFPSTPGIATWHKISEHMCLNCAPSNGSTVSLGLVPSLSSILQPGYHKLCLGGFISHTGKLKVSVNRIHRVPNTLTIVLTQENPRRW